MITVCAYCKKIRKKDGSWADITIKGHEALMKLLSALNHGMCAPCAKKHFPDFWTDPDFEDLV